MMPRVSWTESAGLLDGLLVNPPLPNQLTLNESLSSLNVSFDFRPSLRMLLLSWDLPSHQDLFIHESCYLQLTEAKTF